MTTASVPSGGLVAGVDIGGTKIAVLVVDASGAVLGRATRSSSVGDQDGAAEAIVACLDDALATSSLDRAELRARSASASPAASTRRRARSPSRSTSAGATSPLKAALESRLGRPVVVENDARAAAIGLHERGVLGDFDDLAYLAVGTGIAAGVVLDGTLHRGARGMAGEIGHAIADRDGPVCACGQHGCLEAFASGPALARRARPGHRQGRLRRPRPPATRTPATSSTTSAAGSPGRSTCSS